MNPKNDPLVKAMRKARKASAVGQLQDLLALERRWKSKETLASNKLKAVRADISRFALQLSRESDKRGELGNVLAREKVYTRGDVIAAYATGVKVGGDK